EKGRIFPFLLAVTYIVKYFYTASSGVPNFPEFVGVGLVDEVQMIHYDSNTKRTEPKQDWMKKVTADDPQYWERQTGKFVDKQQIYKAEIEIIKRRINKTGGVHTYQTMYGCDWDDETGDVNGFLRLGYDGEDFISFDLKEETWIAAKPESVITKHKFNNNKGLKAQLKQYYTQLCPDRLKNYVNYGRSSLLRTELPSVSLLQKNPSSPVSCHATGFYPNRATLIWRKDQYDLHENMDHGEILPNHDGSFQMSVDLDLSSVKPEDWGRYECVFRLSGMKDGIITRLDKDRIRNGEHKFILLFYFHLFFIMTFVTFLHFFLAIICFSCILLLFQLFALSFLPQRCICHVFHVHCAYFTE
uniref:Ig-like domain-containing protein n=1 Tax=Mola mola TaxID=94237 RepID=A0A3Q4ALI0_MOLML